MSAPGKTVRIYLADGSPTGIRHAEVVNWTGQALVCPRHKVALLKTWEEARRPGVYFLLGESEETSEPVVYVGEAENVFDRLKTHASTKDFWDQVVFFTSKDDNLTKVHVKYLESRTIELAKQLQRMPLENATIPKRPKMSRPDCDAMEEFLGPMRMLLGALGFNFLQSVTSKGKGTSVGTSATEGATSPTPVPAGGATGTAIEDLTLEFKLPKRKVDAKGASTDEGFVVYAGSLGALKVRDSLTSGWSGSWAKRREGWLGDGTLVIEGDSVRFTKDVLFKSPSAAAAIVCGGAYNGRIAWKDPISGKTLKELEQAALADDGEDAPAS